MPRYSIVALIALVFLASCQPFSREPTEASQLFIEATHFINEAEVESQLSYEKALERYLEAHERAQRLITSYPTSSKAVNLTTNKERLGPYSWQEFTEQVIPTTEEKAKAEQDLLRCSQLLAQSYSDSGLRLNSLANIAETYAHTNRAKEAIAVIKLIASEAGSRTSNDSEASARQEREYALAKAFQGIGTSIINIDPEDLAQANQIAVTMSEPVYQAKVLSALAVPYARSGQKGKARELMLEANTALLSVDTSRRSSVAWDMVVFAGYAGLPDEAFHFANHVDSLTRSTALLKAEEGSIEAGLLDVARKLAEDSDKLVLRGLNELRLRLAIAYVEHNEIDEAEQIFSTVKNRSDYDHAYTRMAYAVAMKEYGVNERASDLITEAKPHAEIVYNNTNDWWSLLELANLAELYAKAGYQKEAIEIIEFVRSRINDMYSNDLQSSDQTTKDNAPFRLTELLEQVVAGYLAADERDAAWKAASDIPQDISRFPAYGMVIQEYRENNNNARADDLLVDAIQQAMGEPSANFFLTQLALHAQGSQPIDDPRIKQLLHKLIQDRIP